jgi:hypothetical protein
MLIAGWKRLGNNARSFTGDGVMNVNMLAAPALAALLLLAGCGEPSSPDVLKARVAQRMASKQECDGKASVQYLPDGARITMPDSALFIIGRAEVSPCGQYAMASAIEAMLSSAIMRVEIEPGGNIDAPYAGLVSRRLDALETMFAKSAFVPYQPPVLVQSISAGTAGVWGVVLTVRSSS